MSYYSIDNLYKNQTILLFKECYAMEKIHGTSTHISFNKEKQEVIYFAGGEKYDNFIKIFDTEKIKNRFVELDLNEVTIFGEAYGGKCQGMSETYGKELKFVAFEVKICDNWLSVPQAESFVKNMGLEFVHYEKVETNLEILDKLVLAYSIQAVRNGLGEGKLREGIVLRPLVELKLNDGNRVIAKYKNEKFTERQKQPKVHNINELEILTKANEIAEEWITEMRLTHVLDNFKEPKIENTPEVIRTMIEDVYKEAKGEIIESKQVEKAISKKTAKLFKNRLFKKVDSK